MIFAWRSGSQQRSKMGGMFNFISSNVGASSVVAAINYYIRKIARGY